MKSRAPGVRRLCAAVAAAMVVVGVVVVNPAAPAAAHETVGGYHRVICERFVTGSTNPNFHYRFDCSRTETVSRNGGTARIIVAKPSSTDSYRYAVITNQNEDGTGDFASPQGYVCTAWTRLSDGARLRASDAEPSATAISGEFRFRWADRSGNPLVDWATVTWWHSTPELGCANEPGPPSDPPEAPPAPPKPVLFVHGIGADFRAPGFANLLQTLRDDAVRVEPFEYYQDVGAEEEGECQSDDYVEPSSAEMPWDPNSISPDICDSRSDLGLNAVLLGEEVERLYHEEGDRPVVIVAHSMGGAITRGMLGHSIDAGDGIADTMVDSVVFLEAAHDGSHLAAIARAVDILQSDLRELTRLLWGDLGRPAVRQLKPNSSWYDWANGRLPSLPYFNVYGDIRTVQTECFVFFCQDLIGVNWGDIVMLPGTDDPFDTPLRGGARFVADEPGPDSWQWRMPKRITWSIGSNPDKGSYNAIAAHALMLAEPESHFVFSRPGRVNEILVTDCRNGDEVSLRLALSRVILGRVHDDPYECRP